MPTSPTSGGHLVGIVRLEATGHGVHVSLVLYYYNTYLLVLFLTLHILPVVIFFFKFFFRNESDVVNNLSEVYSIGTFAQIHEIQDLGDRVRLVVMAHRRIRLLGQIVDDSEAPPGKHI